MKISPDNPHLIVLRNELLNEGLGSIPSINIIERSAMLGISVEDYRGFMESFPFLTKDEAHITLERIIAWYRAKMEIQRISQLHTLG